MGVFDYELSPEQALAFRRYVSGHNVLITGPGGSGKSLLIRHIYNHAHSSGQQISVTALTGCAAILLEGCRATTLHSWARLGVSRRPSEEWIRIFRKDYFAKMTWRTTDVLVIDEVSMLSLDMFETLDDIGRAIRGKPHVPFGGIQLIFTGDFYQLPPVSSASEPTTRQFCFESDRWFDVFALQNHVQLRRIFRQATDPTFTRILEEVRVGRIRRSSVSQLEACVGRVPDPHQSVRPTVLFPTKAKVADLNARELSHLPGVSHTYVLSHVRDIKMSETEKEIRRDLPEKQVELELQYLTGAVPCMRELTLKVGAQVMCVINIKDIEGRIMLCNGSQGVVIGFDSVAGLNTVVNYYPKVRFSNGIERVMSPHTWPSERIVGIGIQQIPLILAWALTIHKCQGVSLDMAEIDVGNGIFECGQTYVALSRVRTLNGLHLKSFDVNRIQINPKAARFYDALPETLVDNLPLSVPTSRPRLRTIDTYFQSPSVPPVTVIRLPENNASDTA